MAININSGFQYGAKGSLDAKNTFGTSLDSTTLSNLITNNDGYFYIGQRVTNTSDGRQYIVTKNSNVQISDFKYIDNGRFFVTAGLPSSLPTSDHTTIGDVHFNTSSRQLSKKTDSNAWTVSATLGGVQVTDTPVSDQVAIFTTSDTVRGLTGLRFINATDVTGGLYVDNKVQIRGSLNLVGEGSPTTATIESRANIFNIANGLHNGTTFSDTQLVNFASNASSLNIASSAIDLPSGVSTRNIRIGNQIDSHAVNLYLGSAYNSHASFASNLFMYGNIEMEGRAYTKPIVQTGLAIGNITIDFSKSNIHYLELSNASGANTLVLSDTTPKAGATYIIFFKMPANYTRTITFPSSFINMESGVILDQTTSDKYYSWTGVCIDIGTEAFRYFGVIDEAAKNLL